MLIHLSFSPGLGERASCTTLGRRLTMLVGRAFLVVLMGAFCWAAVASPASAAVIYVDAGATGGNSGTSWGDAYTDLADGLADCGAGDEVWASAGVYTPPPFFGFQLVDGCGVYGGFSGTETSRAEADPTGNPTVLSGDVDGNDPVITDNAHHVVWVGGEVGPTSVLDGFTITAGYADGGSYFEEVGAGMIFFGGSPTLSRLIIEGNHAEQNGAAANMGSGSTPAFDRCVIRDNDSGVSGGAMYITQSSHATFTNCLFYGNRATGPAPYGVGGAMHIVDSDPTLINCTVADNEATSYGGGIVNDAISGGSHPALVNCILWGNSDAGGETESSNMWNGGSSAPVVTYTDWQGHGSGTGNLDDDPLFVDPSGGDYAVQACSSVIDVGDNATVSGVPMELGGGPRIKNEAVDMGAYERDVRVVHVAWDAAGGDGSSWANAKSDLGDAMLDCCPGDLLWVKEGSYIPPVYWGFQPADGCKLYGGFAGGETSFGQRDPEVNETILDGDRNQDDPIVTDNSHHVLWIDSDVGPRTVLDGLVIEHGYADGGTYFDRVGAGMIVFGGAPRLAQLVFRQNYAEQNGAAINIASGSALSIDRCTFHDNRSVVSGGALYITQDSDITLSNSLFHHNLACDDPCETSLYGAGGAMHIVHSNPAIVNCTIAYNTAADFGGGIVLDAISGGSHPAITNSILWFNSDDGGQTESSNLWLGGSSSPVVTYTDWQGHFGGAGNINFNPLFTATYSLQPFSAAINAGTNDAAIGDLELGGGPRILQLTVDMGAYEQLKKKIRPVPY